MAVYQPQKLASNEKRQDDYHKHPTERQTDFFSRSCTVCPSQYLVRTDSLSVHYLRLRPRADTVTKLMKQAKDEVRCYV
jgi:hypothetical protein